MEPVLEAAFTEAPPERRRAGGRQSPWEEIAADLRANPGLWRPIAIEAPSSLVAKIKSGRIGGFQVPDGQVGMFDAVLRDIDPLTKRGTIHAAYFPGRTA